MGPMPDDLKAKLEKQTLMNQCCIPQCHNDPTWEHSWIYQGRQINSEWALIGLCYDHHQGDEYMIYLNQKKVRAKDWGKYITLIRGIDRAKENYPKKNWDQELRKLEYKLFG